MNSVLARAIFKVGSTIRNPSLSAQVLRVGSTEFASEEELRETQVKRLRSFLQFAEKWSPYYRELFSEYSFSANSLKVADDLGQLPTTSKALLVAENKRIHAEFRFEKRFKAETSGTSGTALEFYKDEEWDSAVRAHLIRGYARFGVHPADRNGYLWGYNIRPDEARKVRLLDWLQNRRRIFELNSVAVRQFAEEMKSAVFIGGYSSMVYEVAKAVNTLGLKLPNLKMVKGTSEMILGIYQDEAERAFGRRIVSEYGAAEAGLIAFECEHGSLHVNEEDVLLEVDADGSVLVTNFLSRSFPIIRYRLGDIVELSNTPCVCGRAHQVITEISGRKGAVVVGVANVYPALTFYYVFKNIALEHGVLLNYRVAQSEKGKVTISIEHMKSASYERLVRSELARYFTEDLEADIIYVESFPLEKRKAQYFVSSLS